MQLVDTHCHIHALDYPLDSEYVLNDAHNNGVEKLICVGEDLEDSRIAIEFAKNHLSTWASIGIHPHESKHYVNNKKTLKDFEKLAENKKVVAIGECGLDYHYDHSGKAEQKEILKFQLSLAEKYNLPLIFHVRDAFDDFWEIFDKFENLRGVIHSFTANREVLQQIIDRGLFVGLNGIMTFTKNAVQLDAARNIPIERLIVETDAPYLTPVPFRGTICQPKHVRYTVEFLAKLRGEKTEELAERTSKNAINLFNLKD